MCNEYTFDACVVVSIVDFSCCAIGINQSPVGRWRSASSTTLLVAGSMTRALSRVNQVGRPNHKIVRLSRVICNAGRDNGVLLGLVEVAAGKG